MFRLAPVLIIATAFLFSGTWSGFATDSERKKIGTASQKRMTCIGEVLYGSLDSAIGECTILMTTKEASVVFRVCKGHDNCTIDAAVEGSENVVTHVFSVKKN